jgi:hypothetical protein
MEMPEVKKNHVKMNNAISATCHHCGDQLGTNGLIAENKACTK